MKNIVFLKKYIIRMKSGQFNEQNRYRNFNNYVNEKLSDIEYPEQFSHDGISSMKME